MWPVGSATRRGALEQGKPDPEMLGPRAEGSKGSRRLRRSETADDSAGVFIVQHRPAVGDLALTDLHRLSEQVHRDRRLLRQEGKQPPV